MFSYEGIRFANQVLAGKEPALGSHISLGINVVYDAKIDGSWDAVLADTHNRYHSPYIVDDIPMANSSVVSTSANDHIVFSAAADPVKRYYANNMALVMIRPSGSIRSTRILTNVGSDGWVCEADAAQLTRPNDGISFNNDGILQLESSNVAAFTTPVSLASNTENDLFAFPLYFTNALDDSLRTSALDGVSVGVRFHFLANGVGTYCEYTGTIQDDGAGKRFDNDPTNNYFQDYGSLIAPTPFIFQKRFSDFDPVGTPVNVTPQTMLNNGGSVYKIEILTSPLTPAGYLRFGSIQITPDFEATTERVTVNFRKLTTPLWKTNDVTYTNAEYRIKGV